MHKCDPVKLSAYFRILHNPAGATQVDVYQAICGDTTGLSQAIFYRSRPDLGRPGRVDCGTMLNQRHGDAFGAAGALTIFNAGPQPRHESRRVPGVIGQKDLLPWQLLVVRQLSNQGDPILGRAIRWAYGGGNKGKSVLAKFIASKPTNLM